MPDYQCRMKLPQKRIRVRVTYAPLFAEWWNTWRMVSSLRRQPHYGPDCTLRIVASPQVLRFGPYVTVGATMLVNYSVPRPSKSDVEFQ